MGENPDGQRARQTLHSSFILHPYSWSFAVIVVMNPNAPQASIDRVVAEIERMGARPHLSRGQFRTVIGAVGEEAALDQSHLMSLDGVEKVVQIMKPYKLAS